MSNSILIIDTPKTCGDCPLCIFTADEKRRMGYCNTSDEDYYCKVLERFMEYDKVDGGVDIFSKPTDCPLQAESEDIISNDITKAGSQIEMLVDDTWIKGTVIEGYRYQDGIVTIETADGHRYWCGQDRTDIYRRIKEN